MKESKEACIARTYSNEKSKWFEVNNLNHLAMDAPEITLIYQSKQ
jgi:hypothetical protein